MLGHAFRARNECLNVCLAFQNLSESDTTTSSKGKADFENKIASDRGKRFEYLLKQTEIFSHFMSGASGKSPEKPKGRPKKPKESEVAE